LDTISVLLAHVVRDHAHVAQVEATAVDQARRDRGRQRQATAVGVPCAQQVELHVNQEQIGAWALQSGRVWYWPQQAIASGVPRGRQRLAHR
jgi:hypothetical protein